MWDENTVAFIQGSFFLFVALAGIIDGIISLFTKGKKLVKIKSDLGLMFNVTFVCSSIIIFIERPQQLLFLLFLVIVISVVIRYFSGYSYSVNLDDRKNLLVQLETALKEIINSDFEKEEEEEEVLYTLANSAKVIEVKTNVSTFKKKKSYSIHFKKWFDYEGKREIIYFLESALEEAEVKKKSKMSFLLENVFILILMIAVLMASSKSIMEPDRLTDLIYFEETPKLYVIHKDVNYENQGVIRGLIEELEDLYHYKVNKTYVNRQTPLLLLYSGERETGRQIYISKSGVYQYVPYAEIGDKSILHKIFWGIHNIYAKEDGNYYSLFSPEEGWKSLVDDILDTVY
ncbi:hypothetical protein [Alkaliphilus transvaalensis]|uniref:hypothetical protein n=1 Tax=Alkaliphilus transvaalensis TaxID=114628 RepID=UPI0004796CB3|nr:hypothetical protein [Alkaliphilus transvaalensis]